MASSISWLDHDSAARAQHATAVAIQRAGGASRRDSDSDLVPYWIFETPGGDSIERRVFDMPFSRDEARYKRLRKSLSLYRLVFAQPRQEDLLAYLTEQLGEQLGAEAASQWKISLEPRDQP